MGDWQELGVPAAAPAQATTVASAETGTRAAGAKGQTILTITTTVTAPAGDTATYLDAWISKDAGTSYDYRGVFGWSAGSPAFDFHDYAPTADADGVTSPKWLVKVLLSNTHATSVPSSAVTSAAFTVLAIAQPGANVCSNAHLGTTGFTKDADGTWSWAAPVIWDIALTPEVWTTELQVRNVDVARTPMPGQYGQWRTVGQQDHPGETVTENNLAGWPILDAAFQYKYYEFQLRARSRAGTDATAWVVQTTAWSGAAFLDYAPAVQAAGLDAARIDPTTLGGALAIAAGELNVAALGILNSHLSDDAVQARNLEANAIAVGGDMVELLAIVDAHIGDVGVTKLLAGTRIFTGDVFLSRGTGNPTIALSNSGIFLYGSSTGGSGLASLPHVTIQSTGILVASVTGGPSVLVNSAGLTLFAVNGSLVNPYLKLDAVGVALVNGAFNVSLTASTLSMGQSGGNNLLITAQGIAISATGAQLLLSAGAVTLSNSLGQSLALSAGAITMRLNASDFFSLTTTQFTIAHGGLSTVIAGNAISCNTLFAFGSVSTTILSIGTGGITSAVAGAATLPANPVGFAAINVNGVSRKFPYYA